MMNKLSFLLILITASLSCSNESDRPIEQNQKPANPQFNFAIEGKPYEADTFKAYIKKAAHTGKKELLIVGHNMQGDITLLRLKDILSPSTSFNVEAGAKASLAYIPQGNEKLTTELTMDNNSVVIIEKYDTLTKTISGKFDSVFCSNRAGIQYQIAEGSFTVRYEEITAEDQLTLTIKNEAVEPAMTFAKSIPEPLNTLQITGFNGGTESYTLILKNDLLPGTYDMHEFDVAPYFFFSDQDLNQYDAVHGTITIDSFDIIDRVLLGRFEATMHNGIENSQSSGEFSIFVM